MHLPWQNKPGAWHQSAWNVTRPFDVLWLCQLQRWDDRVEKSVCASCMQPELSGHSTMYDGNLAHVALGVHKLVEAATCLHYLEPLSGMQT